MKIKGLLIIALGWIINCVLISSAPAGVENRPINTDDAYTLDKGALTVALGAVFTKEENSAQETDLTIDLGYGITDKLEVTANIPFVFSDPKGEDDQEGLGDITLRPEFLFWKEAGNIPAVSFASSFKLQSGNEDRGLGSGETNYSLSLQFSKQFNPFNWHFNIGYTFVGQPKGEAVDDVIFYNLACEYSVSEKLTLMAELIGQTNSDSTAADEPFECLLGLVYPISENIDFDFGVGTGLTNASPDIRVTSGLTYQF
ncbi:MAG: transporter [Candidatus Omnitrophota bacterium]